jgi:general secretion pathway protein G
VHGATYLRNAKLPVDPWDHAYVYEPPEPGNPEPRIYTLGRDGMVGGTGEDADVDNASIRDGE